MAEAPGPALSSTPESGAALGRRGREWSGALDAAVQGNIPSLLEKDESWLDRKRCWRGVGCLTLSPLGPDSDRLYKEGLPAGRGAKAASSQTLLPFQVIAPTMRDSQCETRFWYNLSLRGQEELVGALRNR